MPLDQNPAQSACEHGIVTSYFRDGEEDSQRCCECRAVLDVDGDPVECSCAMTEASMWGCPIHGLDAPPE